MTTPMMRVDSIDARGRHRHDLGRIDELARSIEGHGLIHPIAVTPDRVLVAGARRLAAFADLGRAEIPVHVMASRDEAAARVKAEMAENVDRKDWLPTEKVAIAKAIRSIEERAAKARQGVRTDLGSQLPADSAGSVGEVRDKIADAVGLGRTALAEAEKVVDAARDTTLPEKVRLVAQDAAAQMDRTGKVSPAARKVAQAKAEAAARRRAKLAVVPEPKPLSPKRRREMLENGYTMRLRSVASACRTICHEANTGDLTVTSSPLLPDLATDEIVAALDAAVDTTEAEAALALIEEAKAALTRYGNALAAQVEHQRKQVA